MCNCKTKCSCGSGTINSGLNGYNAFTKLTSSFIQPAFGANVTISVSSDRPNTGSWAATGQIIFIENGGYYEVVTEGESSLVVKNLASATDYINNAPVGATIVTGGIVSPAGLQSNESLSPVVNFSGRFTPGGTDLTPTGDTLGYALFFNRELKDYLSKIGDSVEIEFIYSPFQVGKLIDSTRILLNGVTLNVFDNSGIEAEDQVYCKYTIIRISDSAINYKSEFKMLVNSTNSTTNKYLENLSKKYVYHTINTNVSNFNTALFQVEVDISEIGTAPILNYLEFRYYPLITLP